MSAKTSFGQWLKQRRKALDLSLDELAERVSCATVTLYKIEAGERRPSRQIAELLAQNLIIPVEDRSAFISFARGDEVKTHWGAPPTNVTAPTAPLIGRQQDIAAVRKCLGKTRLSLAVAHEVLGEFSDGVFFVPLAPISDPELVPRVITQTLGIQETGPQPVMERLKARGTTFRLPFRQNSGD
jgi:transcriptional regulator with XRE-family HTH domain